MECKILVFNCLKNSVRFKIKYELGPPKVDHLLVIMIINYIFGICCF